MSPTNLLAEFTQHLRTERGLAETTVTTYRHHTKAYLESLQQAECAAAEATPEHITAHIGRLRERGLRSSPIFCAAVAIRAFHRFLFAKGHVNQDPTADIKLPKLNCRVSEPLSVDEVGRLLAVVPDYGFVHVRDRVILELLYGCGLRFGEALGLDVTHVHLGEGYIKVRGKGSRERLVPAGPKAMAAVRSYLELRQERFSETSGALFLSRNGMRLKKGGLGQRLKRYAARAGIARNFHAHLLRHSFAVHLLAGHADLRSLQLLLGHSSLATTQKYLNLDWASLQETCQRAHPRF